MSETQRVLPLFPLEQVVLFPGMSLPLRIFEERYKFMIGACQVTDQLFGVVLIHSGREVGDLAELGAGRMYGAHGAHRPHTRWPDAHLDGRRAALSLDGPGRVMPEGYLVGDVEMLAEPDAAAVDAALLGSITRDFTRYQQSILALTGRGDPASAPNYRPIRCVSSYRVAATLYVDSRERQRLLEIDDVAQRLQQELTLLKREMPERSDPSR